MRDPRHTVSRRLGAGRRLRALFGAIALLLASCGGEPAPRLRGCAPDHDAAGAYRFAPGYLDERLRLLEDSLRIEERVYDRDVLVDHVARMRASWTHAVLVLGSDGTFDLSGVDHPRIPPTLRGAWEVQLDGRACRLLLRGPGDTLRALLGDGWVIPWFEEPQPGVVLDVQLVRSPDGR